MAFTYTLSKDSYQTARMRRLMDDLNLLWKHMSEGRFSDVTAHSNIVLTHLCQVGSSTVTLWTGPFPI